jgi:hypothetical protein
MTRNHRPVLAPARIVRPAVLLAVCFFPVILHAGTQPAPPERPRELIDTRLAATPVTGQTIVVSAGGELQAALDRAAPGDEIVLEAGATFTGNFVLPARPADGRWTTIRSSRMDDLPADGHRVGPEHAAAMPRIVDPSGNGAFRTVAGSCYWRIVGLEITVAPDVENAWALVHLGSGGPEQHSLEQVPHHLILDRVLVHGDPRRNCFRCVALNGAHCAIIDSHLAEGHAEGFDAQAVCGWNGPGPFKIVNNRLEGSGENVMFGGADPSIPGLVPSDIEFRGNHCFKPLTWNIDHPGYAGIPWTVKNLFELKNAQRVLIEGNLFVGYGEGRAQWASEGDRYPPGSLFEPRQTGSGGHGDADWAAVGFVDFDGGDYRLSPASPYRGRATDGSDLGADPHHEGTGEGSIPSI